jgi:hypothetical protein
VFLGTYKIKSCFVTQRGDGTEIYWPLYIWASDVWRRLTYRRIALREIQVGPSFIHFLKRAQPNPGWIFSLPNLSVAALGHFSPDKSLAQTIRHLCHLYQRRSLLNMCHSPVTQIIAWCSVFFYWNSEFTEFITFYRQCVVGWCFAALKRQISKMQKIFGFRRDPFFSKESVFVISERVFQFRLRLLLWYDIFVNCSWVDARWLWYSTYLHTNNT